MICHVKSECQNQDPRSFEHSSRSGLQVINDRVSVLLKAGFSYHTIVLLNEQCESVTHEYDSADNAAPG